MLDTVGPKVGKGLFLRLSGLLTMKSSGYVPRSFLY